MRPSWRQFLPSLQWAHGYNALDFRSDLFAGFTTAVMLVPQGMGYALLAGLPPIVGLYAATVPLVVYALLGTSRVLAVGPGAMDSLLVAAAVSGFAQDGTGAYAADALMLAALAGTIQLLLGFIGLGFVVNFLSRPVITGFTSAAALIISASQLRHLLGVHLPATANVFAVLRAALDSLPTWKTSTVVVGGLALITLLALKRWAPRVPRAMVVVVLSSLAVSLFDLQSLGVATVGAVPQGLPPLSLGRLSFDPEHIQALLPAAATIALLSYIQAISVGRHYAHTGGSDVRAGQELIALGAANVASSFFSGYPVTGGFSRTAINAQAGARTPAAGIVTAGLVTLTLVFFTPAFATLPLSVLASIVLAAVLSLFDYTEAQRLWRIKRSDFAMMLFTFGATLTLGIQYGVFLGVGASVALFLYKSTRPHFAELGRIPGTENYINLSRQPHAERTPGVLVIRVDSQLYFGNATFLKDTLRALAAAAKEPIQAVVIHAGGVNQLDTEAESTLRQIASEYAAAGVRLYFSHVKGPVRDVMHRSGLLSHLDAESRIFLRTHDAVMAARGDLCRPGTHVPTPDERAPADRIGCGDRIADKSDNDAGSPAARHH